ncbi:uncharacterized protein LOC142983002 [Anticarsia gemmatalis]|uniref:uncharacterized protein LOC142983002 n=1 Tax=Anticarsia gemmatalis TaxID=129554 RepID=UPI003F76B639
MKLLIFTILIPAVLWITEAQIPLEILEEEDCVIPRLKFNYQTSIYHLLVLSYKAVALHSNVNFVFSPTSIWIMLAAIAEGGDEETQKQLFRLLNLPDDRCLRQKYYKIATSRTIQAHDFSYVETRALLIDDSLSINPGWLDFVSKNHLLDVLTAPIKSNPEVTISEIRRVMAADVPRLDLSGNSVLLNAVDYNALWATAFADAVIERSPFFNTEGEIIGSVDLMRVKRRAKMAYLKSLNAKVLELPIGFKNRHSMFFAIFMDTKQLTRAVAKMKNNVIFELLDSLKESKVPIDIAIPRVEITGQVDLKTVLEDLGVNSLWTDPDATQYISSPPALPSSYLQRTTLTLDKYGIAPPPLEVPAPETDSGLAPEVGTDFIANQPFFIGLLDTETYTPLLTVAFTTPTYR